MQAVKDATTNSWTHSAEKHSLTWPYLPYWLPNENDGQISDATEVNETTAKTIDELKQQVPI